MTNLKEILNPTVALGTADFVASGTLPNGSPTILKSDGTVEVISLPTGGPTVETTSTFHTSTTFEIHSAFDPTTAGRFVVVYKDGGMSNRGTAVVGQVSGTTMTYGAEVVFYADVPKKIKVHFDPSSVGKFVISYKEDGNQGVVIAGEITGTVPSFGTGVTFNAATVSEWGLSFDPSTAGRFVVSFDDSSNSNYGTCIIGSVASNVISLSSKIIFNSGYTIWNPIAFDPNTAGRFVICYRDLGDGTNNGKAVIGTVTSSSAITFGTKVTFNSAGRTDQIDVAFNPTTSGQFAVIYQDDNNSDASTVIIGQVAGVSTLSFGTAAVLDTTPSGFHHVAFDPFNADKIILHYLYSSSYTIKVNIGTIAGTSVSFGTAVTVNTVNAYNTSMSIDPNTAGDILVCYREMTSSTGQAALLQLPTSNLTSTNFLGTSAAAYTNAQTATIMLQGGVSDNQTGLTVGSTYYVQPDGTLATTAGTPSVEAGKALSATSLLLSDTADPAVALNTAKVTNSTSASDLASGTLPDTVFPATLPAISGANLTNLPSSGISMTSATTAPSSPTVGDQWYDTANGVLYVRVTDGTDEAWLDISSANGTAAAAGGGAWEVIQSQTVSSSVTSVVFNTGITGYTHYKLLFTCYYSGHTTATTIWVSSDGGSTYEGNSWKAAQTTVKSDGIAANNAGWASSGGKLGINRYNNQHATTQYLSAEVIFTGLTEGVWTHANSDCINYVSNTTASAASTFAIMPTTTAYNAIKISEVNSTVTIDSGTFTLYGIKNS
tara:strand:- start:9803 stop:12121 length:2319 start_codon:yes stop_codon:yes gene_type:complete